MHPYYVIRAIGGLLFVLGALVMVFNFWMTLRGKEVDETDRAPALVPAE
jgi:cytochrome c oxidase cbb3-type subunit 1